MNTAPPGTPFDLTPEYLKTSIEAGIREYKESLHKTVRVAVPEHGFGNLLTEIVNRPRILDRDSALEPDVIRTVLAALDAEGPSQVGDVLHSLLWRAQLLDNRAKRFGQELSRLAQVTHE